MKSCDTGTIFHVEGEKYKEYISMTTIIAT